MDPASKRPHSASSTAGCAAVSSKIRPSASRSRSLAWPPSYEAPLHTRDSSGICATESPDPREKEKRASFNQLQGGYQVGKLLFQGLRISYSCVTVDSICLRGSLLPCLLCRSLISTTPARPIALDGRPPASLSLRHQLGEPPRLVSSLPSCTRHANTSFHH